jgi:hypothetical protein
LFYYLSSSPKKSKGNDFNSFVRHLYVSCIVFEFFRIYNNFYHAFSIQIFCNALILSRYSPVNTILDQRS